MQQNGITAAINSSDLCTDKASYPIVLVSSDPAALDKDPLVLSTLLNAVTRLSFDCQRNRFFYDVPIVTPAGEWNGETFLFSQTLPAFALPSSMLTKKQEDWVRNDPGTFTRISPQFINLVSGYWDETRILFGENHSWKR